MITAVCPGSFDPVTYGHLDIIRRAASMFDRVIVLVVTNLAKQPMFTKEERMDFLRRATSGLDNVEVDSYGGLLADYTREHDARVIVKGLRAMSDFEYEFQRALLIKKIDNNLETVFIMTNANYSFLSSSGIRELATFGGCIHGLVPECVEDRIKSLVISKE